MELAAWRKHIAGEVDDNGMWIGIADEEGYPIMDVPPIISASLPDIRLGKSDAEVVVRVPQYAPILDDLIAAGIGNVDSEGRLIPSSGPARFIISERAGSRNAYTVVPSVASGGAAITQLSIKGVDAIEILSWWPAPSIPLEWSKASFSDWTTDASGQQYARSRRLAQVPVATKADGYTVAGKARSTIQNLIQDSFDAVNQLMGWDGTPHAVVDFADVVDTSPEVLIRVTDDYVWDTIAEPARTAGVSVTVDLWWPGDPPIRVRTSRDPASYTVQSPKTPIFVVRVSQMREG